MGGFYFVSLITSTLITAILTTINYWDITDLEKKLLSNIQKFRSYISLSSTLSVITTISFMAYLILTYDNKSIFIDIIKKIDERNFTVVLKGILPLIKISILMFIGLLILNLIIAIIVTIITKVFSVQKKFYINYNNEKWYVVKRTKKGLLLKNKNKNLIIQEWHNVTIYTDDQTLSKWEKIIYTEKVHKILRTSSMVIIVIFAVLLVLIKLNFGINIYVKCSIIIFFPIVIITLLYLYINKKYIIKK